MPQFNRAQILCWIILTSLTLVHGYDCAAQFTDNFTDGDFSANPGWTGTDTRFVIESGQLRLFDTAPASNNISYLSTASQAIDNASWEFFVRLNFDPSTANYADVYLVSTSSVLTGSLNGYFVRIGHTATDNVSLFIQTGTTKTAIITGTIASLTAASTPVRVKVTRDQAGNWQLLSDAGNTGNYQSEGTVNNLTHRTAQYFGIVSVYTTTRNQHFYFDDFLVSGDPYVDPAQPAAYKDVIITEIFADPSPVIGLPEAEFIEIFNRSNKIINLAGWKFTDGSSTAILSGTLQPGDYRIITATSSASLFASFGPTLGVANFPTLNNSSDNLELKRNDDMLIDKVSYSDTWYQDDDKKQGGYTLELIDPANPCGEGDNWIASQSSTGGTPGVQNSVVESKPDLTGPRLVSAIPVSPTLLSIKFSEKLHVDLPLATSFTLTPQMEIANVFFSDASLTMLTLSLSENFQAGTLYTLSVKKVYDCSGNEIQSGFSTNRFGMPEPAEERDLLINEILFNPRPTAVDFVEIHNPSNKYINLKNWSVANYVNGVIINAKPISTQDILIEPHAYLVFTENRNIVMGEYVKAVEENIFVVKDLPSFNDDKGTVALLSPENRVIDFFAYTDKYHATFLKDDEGVSLERISASAPTNDPVNWQSASATSGFATPGYLNSNARGEVLADKVKVDPEIFEPINGQPSFTQIHYNFNTGGYVANVKILDAQGREVKQLSNNSTLGTTGFFRWDGDMNNGSKARTGYYIVWMEVFNSNGKVESFRKRVVVASRFN